MEKFRKVKVLKSVNLHPEYVPRYFRNQMQKKVEYKLTSKKIMGIQADTPNMKKWENGSLIIITRQSGCRKTMVHNLFLCQIMYQIYLMKLDPQANL